jgi:DNA replication protein DnaC
MPTDVETRVRELLLLLGLKRAAERLSEHLPRDAKEHNHVLRVLEQILADENAWRIERRIERRVKAARFPDMPTLESFDFEFQTGIDRDLVMDLALLAWVDRREDLILTGDSGTGKSHIAKALCLIGCKQQRRVLYTSCANMLTDLFASLADNTLTDALKRYTRPELLLIDDLGLDPIEQEQAREAQLLYKVLEARHQKVSTIVTSNLDADDWPDYLGNHYLTVALLDRLLFHGTAINIDGPSWRLSEHRKRQAERDKLREGDQPDSDE